MRKKTLEQTIEELIERFTPEIANAFRAAIADVVDNVVLSRVIAAIEIGDVEAAFRALGFSEGAMRPITAALERTFETGGIAVGATFPRRLFTPDGPAVFRFDVRNIRAENWIRNQAGSLVTRITSDVNTTLRNVLTEGNIAGRNPRSIALDLVGRINPVTKVREGGVIGLNIPQERAVEAARRDLQNLDERYFTRKRRDKRFDSVVRKAFDKGFVDAETQDRLLSRYKDRLLLLRGETIGRDAAIESLNRSQYEALVQADEMGAIGNRGVQKVWDDVGDNRVRDDHKTMDGQTVGLNEPFTFPDGSQALHPQDRSLGASANQVINCRCRFRTKIDWLKGIT